MTNRRMREGQTGDTGLIRGFEEGTNYICMRESREASFKQWQGFKNLGEIFSTRVVIETLVPNNGSLGCQESHSHRKQIKKGEKIFLKTLLKVEQPKQ